MAVPYIEIKMDLYGLLKKHRGMERVLGPMLYGAMRVGVLNAAQYLRDKIRDAAPEHWWKTLKQATGRAKGTMSFYVDEDEWPKMRKDPFGKIVLRTNWLQYIFTEFGRRAVFPVRKPFLYIPLTQRASMNPFTGSYSTPLKNLTGGEDFVFAKRAKATRAQRYAQGTWDEEKGEVIKLVNRPIKEALKRAAM
jgi:hypothetical protein